MLVCGQYCFCENDAEQNSSSSFAKQNKPYRSPNFGYAILKLLDWALEFSLLNSLISEANQEAWVEKKSFRLAVGASARAPSSCIECRSLNIRLFCM